MTPKELLGLDASDIERMTDSELEAIFSPLYHVTRPEFAGKDKQQISEGPIKRTAPMKQTQQQRNAKAMALAAQHGIDLQL